MKPVKPHPAPGHDTARHPQGLGSQQAIAEKSAGSPANVKARVDSKHMPDKPVLNHQHMPNSSGRK